MTESGRDLLGVRELQRRLGQMTSCAEIEEDWNRKEGYLDVSLIYIGSIDTRHLDFIIRHKMTQQFLNEDDAGQR